MVELNLIPWRAAKSIYDKKRQRMVVMLAVLIAVSLWAVLHIYLQRQLDNEREQLKILQLNLTSLAATRSKKNVVTESGFTPQQFFQLFNMLTTATESGTCYQQVAYENHELSLQGQSWSMALLLASLGKMKMPGQFGHYQINKVARRDRFTTLQYQVKYKEINRDKD